MTLRAHDVTLIRGDRAVVREVTATLEPGAITAIVGPNGAGKSSLLMALAGLLEPAQGSVSLGETPLASLDPQDRARAIGYLPQGSDIAWDVSVEALVSLGRMPHRDTRREPVHAALHALDLADLRHRRVSTLSGGELARVLLARVLAGEPRFILADEPLAALDLAHQINLIGHLRGCTRPSKPKPLERNRRSSRSTADSDEGTGVAIVLHDLALAMNHADRVIVLSEGAVEINAAPEAALAPEIIAKVWGVTASWLGEPGQRALVTHTSG